MEVSREQVVDPSVIKVDIAYRAPHIIPQASIRLLAEAIKAKASQKCTPHTTPMTIQYSPSQQKVASNGEPRAPQQAPTSAAVEVKVVARTTSQTIISTKSTQSMEVEPMDLFPLSTISTRKRGNSRKQVARAGFWAEQLEL